MAYLVAVAAFPYDVTIKLQCTYAKLEYAHSDHFDLMNADQCRMARAALRLGIREVADLAKVAPSTVTRLERGEALQERTVDAIRTVLERARVAFIDANGGGPGVRLKP